MVEAKLDTMDSLMDYAKTLPQEARNMVYVVFEDLNNGNIDEREATESLIAILENYSPVQ